MGKLSRKQRKDRKPQKELIETYLSEHPDATLEQIGNFLGVSRQRAHTLVKRVGIRTRRQKGKHLAREHETEILRYISSGYTNEQIAAMFGVGDWTMQRQVSIILAKFKANNRAQAVTLAKEQGLI